MIKKILIVVIIFIINLSLCNTQEKDEFIQMKRTSCYLIARNYIGQIQSKLVRLIKGVG